MNSVPGFPFEVDFIPTATVCAIAVALQSFDSVIVEFDDSDHQRTKAQLQELADCGYVELAKVLPDHRWVVTDIEDCNVIHAIGD